MSDHARSVLFVVEQLRRRVPGGIGAHALGLLGGLGRLRQEGEVIDLTLLASRPPRDPAEDRLQDPGWPMRLSPLPGPLLTRGWDHRLVHAPPSFDVVHSISTAAPLPARRRGGRLVLTVHDLAWRRHPETTTARGARWHEAALRRARQAAAHIVVPSRRVAADVVASGIDEGLITVVPSGADHLPAPDAAGADALLAGLGIGSPYLLTVGTLEPRKNLERLVHAYGVVRETLPEAWPLVVVGPAGWGRQPAVTPGTEGVVFAGTVPGAVLAALYARARAFAYVPLTEGAGLPPLEAMRAGTPALVAKEVPSVDDLGAPGPPPALLVDPFDIEDIATGLASVLTDDTVRAGLSEHGTRYAGERTWVGAARAHLALWRGLG